MALQPARRPVGELLREWRERRRLSQMALALDAEISTRHLSFVETGRSTPSRAMVLRLAEQLDVPLRERNALLLAAGYAPVYPESGLDATSMASVHEAIRRLLAAHEPYPALVIDRLWTLVDANASLGLFTQHVRADLLAPPANVLRASLHPEGLAPWIVNLGEWRAHLLGRLRRQIALTADGELQSLYDELQAYPCDDPRREVELPGPGAVVAPLRVRHDDAELAFFSTVATFGSPLDVTVSELAIELFFPANTETATLLREAGAGRPGAPGGPRTARTDRSRPGSARP